MIRGHEFVDVQSAWVGAHVDGINPAAQRFSVDRVLREPFYAAEGWQPSGSNTVFCTAAYTAPFKGLHVAVRALKLLRSRIPDARLRIAGAHQRNGIRQDGYMRWIGGIVRHSGLAKAIDWLGPLDGEQIVAELQSAAAVAIPSFAETYCVALAEAMRVGTPAVVSVTGGTAHLGDDEHSCLFFPPGDEAACAHQLERVMLDAELARRLSRESREVATRRHDSERIVQRQLGIYRKVLDSR